MRRFVAFSALILGLASCGIDGPPITPDPKPTKDDAAVASTGVVVTGTASIGVSGGSRR